MEQTDTQDVGHDREGLSKRRISSILKAPRTSMKVGVDQDENQDETRPIEKRRNSRRVSFATTNNVRVFPKDIKAEPVLAPIQNMAVGVNERQNERMQSFDTNIKYDFMGLDKSITQPLHFNLNKENFFPEPSSPVDRTVLLGEDTGYMDMTRSHTVIFDKEDELDPEFTLNMSNVCESQKLNTQNGSTCENLGSMEKGLMQSGAQNEPASFSKENTDRFTLGNNSKAKLDEENVLPSYLPKVADLEMDDMDITNIHLAMKEEREAFHNLLYSLGGNFSSPTSVSFTKGLEDMQLTRNQTIDFKELKNANHSMADADKMKCTFVCDDPSEMIMTEVLDQYVQEQSSEQHRADHFQTSALFVPLVDSKEMEALQSQPTGSKTGECKRSMPLATHDRSDFMDLTCQASTEVLSQIHEGSMFTERSNVTIELNHNTVMHVMSKPQTPSIPQLSDPTKMKNAGHFRSELSPTRMDDDMEMTCRTVADDMDMTLCRTLVEPNSSEDYKSKKRVSLALTTFKTGQGMAAEHTGHIGLSRYSFSKRAKTESCVVPTAQTLIHEDLSKSMGPQQSTSSDMTALHDDMELTEFKTITIDTENSWIKSPSNKAPGVSCVSSRPTTDQMKRSEANPETVFAPQADCRSPISVTELDARNLVDKSRDQTADHNARAVRPVEPSEEDSNMMITTAFTAPLERQSAAFNQEMPRETMPTAPITTDSDIDFLNDKHLSSDKHRRRSLADLQLKLRSISQTFVEPGGLSAGSVTAPLVSLTAVTPVKKHSEMHSSLQSSQKTPLLENRTISPRKEATTPFSLKNSLMARLSVSGIKPKLPPRAGSAHPNQPEPRSLQGLQLQTCFSADVQNGSYETDLIDEVLPEDDFSGTLISQMQEVSTGCVLNEDPIKYDHMTSDLNVRQSEEMASELKDEITMKDSSERLQDGNLPAKHASSHEVTETGDSNSSSNTCMKFEGISELSLKNSQLDSQIVDIMDDEFEFNKKCEAGTVTVNELLMHFGAKFVIHRSRPSALPDNFSSAQTYTVDDWLKEKYIHRPKQKVYETDCQHLSEMAEGFKTQMADQEKPLRSLNGTLLHEICAFSEHQLQRFGSKLKEHRGYFRKRNKDLSHRMKEHLYAELLRTAQEAKQSLTSKIMETDKMLKDLDGCITDLESELAMMNRINGDQYFLDTPEPALKAKQEQLDALNSEVTEKQKQICRLELEAQSLEDTLAKVQDETRELKCRETNLNSLNEWRVSTVNEHGVVFAFLHDTLELEVKNKIASGKDCLKDDKDAPVDIAFHFRLSDCSQQNAIMVHKLLKENIINLQATWEQKYPTTQCIPMLLHDVSLVVSRLRLLGEEIHRLNKWGGLRLGILHITCIDAIVEVVFSSLRAFVKFEISMAVTPDYPFRPLQLQKFQNYIGDTRLEQIKDILSSVRPTRNYLTTVIKKIHSDLLA